MGFEVGCIITDGIPSGYDASKTVFEKVSKRKTDNGCGAKLCGNYLSR